MIVLTLDQLLELHALVIAETGGSKGLRDLGRLEAALATQTQTVFGAELYESLHEKAAALIRGIIADHAFVDGNKRTAMLVGLTFLRVNDAKFKARKGELEDFAVQIATEHLDVPAIAAWLAAHSE
jgi:death on curing protein